MQDSKKLKLEDKNMDRNLFNDILNRVNPEILENTDMDLVEEGIIDSLQIMTLVAELEENFRFDFDPDDIMPENFSSPEAIWKTIQKYGVKD